MRHLKYIVYSEDKYYVAQCLNVDISSFGESIDEAVANLKEAVELYLEDSESRVNYHDVGNMMMGEVSING